MQIKQLQKNVKEMIQKASLIKSLILVVFIALLSIETQAQQDPQYTHYMYNTMSVNAAYAGQRDVLSATALYRSQWVGVKGAPETVSFGIHSPLTNERLGLGLNVVSDREGPIQDTYVDINFSYTLPLNEEDLELSFGLKGGLHLLNSDWGKGTFSNQLDEVYADDLSLAAPMVGPAVYLHSSKWYVGLSVPSVLTTDYYKDIQQSTASERLHYFFIAGMVFDVSENVLLKPAVLTKAVSGAPLIADVSLNSLIHDKLTLGLAWRWHDAVSGLVGFQVMPELFIGYSYDAGTTNFGNYNSGSHEIMMRFELEQIRRLISPRFF